jgi:hypothetical protein
VEKKIYILKRVSHNRALIGEWKTKMVEVRRGGRDHRLGKRGPVIFYI